MTADRLRQILKRLTKLYGLGDHVVGLGEKIVLKDRNGKVKSEINRDEEVWINFRLVEEKEFPSDPPSDRFKEVAKETDDDVPF